MTVTDEQLAEWEALATQEETPVLIVPPKIFREMIAEVWRLRDDVLRARHAMHLARVDRDELRAAVLRFRDAVGVESDAHMADLEHGTDATGQALLAAGIGAAEAERALFALVPS